MRILVTNDDGVHAPGLAALVRSLARAANRLNAEIVVAAPLVNHSGASAAVGTVYERDSISYRRFQIAGANEVAVYGLDASPALSVLVAALGGFGPKPDIVASGINLGVNVGRSVLHSGTVGAVLTGAQLGVSGLAVSMRSGVDPECWETAAEIAVEIVAELATAPPRTVLNLNVPSLPIGELRGVRRGRISTAGIVKAASMRATIVGAPALGGDDDGGEIRLRLGAAVPSLGDVSDEEPEDDGALVASGFASLTPLTGVGEDFEESSGELVAGILERTNSTIANR
ncbi:MAG: 5'/3'-nucleotidase SurE [Actinobacteria bacterium]|nr:5'/3'-nucleotidase SurE [Actinomycetota bacterium]